MVADNRPDAADDRLYSWKDIAAYLRRDVSTVQRWEKRQGLPVHRHLHDKQGSVYAFKSELDAWWRQSPPPEPIDAIAGSESTYRRIRHTRYMVVSAIAIVLAVAAAWLLMGRTPPNVDVVRSALPLPADAANAFPAMSPDGSALVYEGVQRSGSAGPLYVKSTNELESRPIPGTEGAQYPFFSPDGNWVAYFARGKLFKVPTRGGAPIPLASASSPRGGTWLSNNTIVFAPEHLGGLFRVESTGGTATPVSSPNRRTFERTHRWPYAIAGENIVLFTVHRANTDSYDDADIEAVRIPTGERTVVVHGGFNPVLAASDHLLYGRNGQIWAAPFDVGRLQLTGPAVAVVEGVLHAGAYGRMAMTLSAAGTLVFAPGGDLSEHQLLWIDRSGRRSQVIPVSRSFSVPRISPDGRYVSLSIDDAVPRVWVLDLHRGSLTRRTSGWDAEVAFWSPNSARLAMRQYWFDPDGNQAVKMAVLERDAMDDGATLRNTATAADGQGSDWSPDGSQIAMVSRGDILLMNVRRPQEITPILRGPDNDFSPRFSPDGRWLAYTSNASGSFQVHVTELAGQRRQFQISNQGGMWPVWARDGTELYFYQPQPPLVMMVHINTTRDFSVTRPQALFELPPGDPFAPFDVAPDGRFILVAGAGDSWRTKGLVMVQNWFDELKRKVPVQ